MMSKPSQRWSLNSIFVLALLLLLLSFSVIVAQDAPPTDEPPATPTEEILPTDVPTEVPTDIPPTEVPPTEVVIPTETAVILPTVEIPPTLTPLPAEPAMALLVRELLDNGDLSPWLLGAGWSLTASEGGFALQVVNSNEAAQLINKGQFFNVAFQARFLVSVGSAQVSLRSSAAGNYTAAVDANGLVTLSRAGSPLGSAFAAPSATWRTVRVSAINDVIRVSVDNVEVIAVQDSAALPPGDVSVSASLPSNADNTGVSGVLVADDLFLWVPVDELGNYPQPTPLPTVAVPTVVPPTTEPIIIPPTVEPTIVPTDVPPTQEPVVDYKDTSLAPPPSAEALVGAQSTGNDDFANAFVVPGTVGGLPYDPYTDSGNSTGNNAGREVGENDPTCGNNTSYTFWYSFTPTDTQSYTITTAGSSFDTTIGVYTGGLGTLVQVGCNDDVSTTVFTSQLALTLTAGTTYRIQVGGYNGRFGAFNFKIQQTTVAVPAAPVLTTPNAGVTLNDETPTLNWNSAGAKITYQLQVCTSAACGAGTVVVDVPVNGLTNTPSLPAGALGVSKTYYWRLRSLNVNGVAGAYGAARTLMIRTAPPTLSLPAHEASTTDTTPTFTWVAFPGATYHIQVDNNNDFSSPEIDVDNATTSYTPLAALTNNTSYYWRVLAKDVLTNATVYSVVRKVTVGPTPPVAPVLVSPNAAATIAVDLPFLDWNASATAATYDLLVDNNSTFVSPEVTQTGLAATDFTVGTNLAPGLYYWKVRGVNSFGGAGLYSAARTFTVRTAPITLTAPAALATLTDTTPTFSWAAYPGGKYDIQVDDDSGFGSPLIDLTNQTLTTYTPTTPLEQGVWYWRVLARDYLGNPTAFVSRSFTINIQTLPANNAIITAPGAASVNFTWIAGGTGTTSYTLRIDNNSDLASPETVITGITTLSRMVTGLAAGQYYWNVEIVPLDGGAPPVPPVSRTFTVSPAAAAAPVLTNPPTGATIADDTPFFDWNASVSTAGTPYTYDLLVDNNSTFVSPEIIQLNLSATDFTPVAGLTPGLYYWKVRTINVFNVAGPWSVVRTITIRTAPPTLSLPADGAIVTDTTPTVSWVAYPGVGTKYNIQIDDDAGFGSPITNPAPLTTVNFTPTTPLKQGTWYWRVQAIDVLTNTTAFSPSRSFVVNIQTAPLNNAIITAPGTASVTFTWIAGGTGTTSYTLRIDNNSDLASPEITRTGLTALSKIETGLAAGEYYWNVEIVPIDGGAPPVPPVVRHFTISPVAPSVPVLLAPPATLATIWDTTPTLTWKPSTTGSPVEYELQVDESATFTLPLDYTATVASGTCAPNCASTTSALTVGKTYYWRVRAKNVYNVYSAFAAAWRFTVGSPTPPSLTAPADNSSTTVNPPTFTWTKPVGAVTFTIYYDTFTPPTTVRGTGLTLTSFKPPSPLTANTWFWRVEAFDALGTSSGLSLIRSVKIATATTAAPVLNRFGPGTTVTLSWGPISWTSGGGWYEIIVDDINTFASPIFSSPHNATVLPGEPGGTHNISEGTGGFPTLANGTWYWKVRACTSSGSCGAYSTIGTFTVER